MAIRKYKLSHVRPVGTNVILEAGCTHCDRSLKTTSKWPNPNCRVIRRYTKKLHLSPQHDRAKSEIGLNLFRQPLMLALRINQLLSS